MRAAPNFLVAAFTRQGRSTLRQPFIPKQPLAA